MLKGVNWIAVLVSLVVLEIVGFLWYAVIFQHVWLAALGTPQDPKPMAIAQGLGMLNTLIIVVGIDWLLGKLKVSGLAATVGAALTAWLFFDFTTMAIEYLYVGHTGTLVLINMGYQLVAYALAGIIFGLLPRKAAT